MTPADEIRTLTVSTDPQGGYLAPAEMSTEFLRDLVLVSPVRGVASVRSTGSPSVLYPRRTGITNAKWKGELQAQEASEPAFGQAEIVIKEVEHATWTFPISCWPIVPVRLKARFVSLLPTTSARRKAAHSSSVTASLSRKGLLTNADIAAVVNGHATNVSTDMLIKLMYAMPAQYRNAGTWGMNSTTLATIRTLKDGQGNYLWQPSFQAGQPETILGRPVLDLPDMPDVAANAFPILFGDFSGYRIVDRIGLSILVNPYLLATNGITRIHATRRVGGGVLQPAKFKKLKMTVS